MRAISFTYKDESYMVFPHIYGTNTSGIETLRAWLSTSSDGTNYQCWRDFDVADMSNIKILGTFHDIREHPNLQKSLQKVYAEVVDPDV